MATQGERQDYLWRPNDESSTTRMRYELEADHWYRAFKSAERKHRPTSLKSDLAVIGLIFSLVGSLLVLVIALIIEFVKWVRS
ncbi:hypothetical protein [Aestuariivivens sediminicola]|uniref:hypothetical protein n=1 Tax=Aestuariivivens sediminicola TaxID=2913560 RepID=UPI001F573035|nr:hypothetical protein [Aestuariivivens sediminicola]